MDRGDARDKISKENLCLFPEKLKGNKTYDFVYYVPTDEIHDSGYRLMALVGYDKQLQHFEIAAYCDVVELNSNYMLENGVVKFDMCAETNIIKLYATSDKIKFVIGDSVSSTLITVVKIK